jgi:lipoyl(octanoyl) transferase
MIYPLIDLKRAGLGARTLVTALEKAVIRLAYEFRIDAMCRADAPGVYVDGRKLASVGLRIRRGASYHGMALNIDADLEPFSRINPCGYRGLEVTSLAKLGITASKPEIRERILGHLLRELGLEGRPLQRTNETPSRFAR